jgi:serine protease Do
MSSPDQRSANGWVVFACSALVSAALLAISLSQPAQSNAPADTALALTAPDLERPQLADLIEAAQPSVVTIAVSKSGRGSQPLAFGGDPRAQEFFERFFGRRMPPPDAQPRVQGVGSGFIIDDAGYIVTNNHVIDDADTITVTLHNGDEHDAELLGTDPKTDLAVLKIDADDLTAARFGDSERARVGDWVVAIGNPFGFGGTATVGIISARGRDLRSGPYDDFLQIDAPINQGNSGGPIFNTRGEVIGVNTAIFSPNGGNVGIGFAIPAAQAQNVVAELKESGSVDRGWLGVMLQDMNDDLAESLGFDAPTGALVADVQADSPADDAGVETGDVIVEFDGKPVESPKALSRMVGNSNSDAEVELVVRRNGRDKRLDVTLGAQAQPLQIGSDSSPGELGLALAPLDDRTREQLGLDDHVDGAVISRVAPSSPAAERGLRRGDVIVSVDQQNVSSPRDVSKAISAAKQDGEDSVLLLLRRGSNQRFATLPLA